MGSPVSSAPASPVGDWPETTVEQAVRGHAAQRPGEVALVGPDTTVTWSQLDRAGDRVAGILAATGGTGSRVAWLGHNDVGYAMVLLGANRQRSALVGLNWRLPDPDLAGACAQVGVTHVFTSAAHADRARAIAGGGVHVEVVDQTTPEPWADQDGAETVPPDVDDLSVVFFTSGSTGSPKAVPIERLSMEIGISTPVAHGFEEDSHLLVVPPVFHLAGAYWVHYGLLYGARQVYLAEAAPKAIVAAMVEHRITHAVFVPTLIRMLIDQLTAEPTELPHFRHLAYGASPITVPMLREAIEVFGAELCQVFGMTEAGGVVTYLAPQEHRIDGAHVGRLASAGTCTVGVEVQVRDLFTGEEVATGESGELWFRTPFMARGYLGRPSDTAEVFRDSWLNTRDVGRVDADGYVYVQGRSDDMIITGGENVHPGEVEGVLADLSEIVESAVFGMPDERWGHRLCAAVVSRTPDLTAEAIVAHCRTRLAGYKIPRDVVFLAELPRTPTGKITRSSLPDALRAGGDT